jgi:glycosyltransferase involved in cell wall biosynthesis
MNWPSVSIAFPCWHRGPLLAKTLESIKRQNYPGSLELVIVEEESDGITKELAEAYGATYINNPRLESYPPFQSITKLWNMCLHASAGDIVLLQTAEVLHESSNVISDLVARVESGTKIMATPLIKDLAQDGTFAGWYNHPREGSRPGWISGAGPHAFRRAEMLEIGGYEELLWGYGHEDDLLFFMLRKNGWSIKYVESAVCAHQWHERTKFEPITGYTNRALIRILTMEIEDGFRPPIANKYPLLIDTSVTASVIHLWAVAALEHGMSDTFKQWMKDWDAGKRHPDDIFVAQRTIANEGLGKASQIGEMITEAAWAVIRGEEARTVAFNAKMAARSTGRTDCIRWAERAGRCADITHTWAARALARAGKLMAQ